MGDIPLTSLDHLIEQARSSLDPVLQSRGMYTLFCPVCYILRFTFPFITTYNKSLPVVIIKFLYPVRIHKKIFFNAMWVEKMVKIHFSDTFKNLKKNLFFICFQCLR